MSRNYSNSATVRQLIDRLYAAFDEPNDLLVDPKFSPERDGIVTEALRYDRRSIPNDVLDDLAWCLATTIGGPQTLRHYLPRIFEEEHLREGLGDMEWWILTGKLSLAGFLEWPPEQRRLTFAALKLMIGSEIKMENAVTEAEFPELAPEAILSNTTVAALIGLLDPYWETPEPWWGRAWRHKEEVEFLIAAERSLSPP